MTRKRNIGAAAALGGLTATIALLTGLSTASADELADLRANQELLQRRIDQLAQAGIPPSRVSPGIAPAMGAEPIPGQSIVGGSFPRSFLIPGTDTSIRVGGFVDITGLYYFNGASNINPGRSSSNSGQNGNLPGLPLNGPIAVPGLPLQATSLQHSRGNGVFNYNMSQSRFNVETRTPTAWGEARTFFEWDFSGCNNFSCQTLQQAGGDSLLPRLRFAYGTLGGFLGGQAISNFSDADADTESMEFGGNMGSTGGYRVPQIRYTVAGPYGSAFSVSAEQPTSSVLTPGGIVSSDQQTQALPSGPGTATIGPTCNGMPCTGAGNAVNANLGRQIAPVLTAASYWAQPWGHVDFAVMMNPLNYNDGKYIDRTFLGYGGHFSGDVKPGWFGWNKDDILFSVVAGEGIGNYASGGEATMIPMATNFTVATACATPLPGCQGGLAASNIIFKPVFGYSLNGGYQHWWLPNLRSTIAAGMAHQDIQSQLIGPNQAISANKELYSAFVNLVWNPVAFITTGIQYMYGQRRVVSNAKGNENVLIGKFRVSF
jgi:Porin subfamily/DcaP outer membrane protein